MLGLFERIGEGLEMLAMPISAAASYANCAVQNFATDVRTEAKCRQIDREAKCSSASEVSNSSSELTAETYIKGVQEAFESAKALSAEDAAKLKDISAAQLADFRKSIDAAIATGDPNEIAGAYKAYAGIDELCRYFFTMRAELACALQQQTPIFQQPASTPLAQQAAQQGGVGGMDIINNLRGQDIQHANPQGINNPGPVMP